MMRSLPVASSRHIVTTALGITLILSWGSSYYLPAVLAVPIAQDTGWPLPWVVSGLSIGLLVGGLASPVVGRIIHRQGGRMVLASGSVLLAAGLTSLALAPSVAAFLCAWVVLGAGMSAALYDAAFGTMGRLYGREARSAITTLTLWAGFASTLCWPLSAWLVEAYGWRNACLAYAALHVAVALPVHLLLIPSAEPADDQATATDAGRDRSSSGSTPILIFVLLAGIQTLAALVASTLSVHLLALLQMRGLTAVEAVSLGALIGPAQVGARVLEMLVGRRHHPVAAMTVSIGLIATGVALLALHVPLPGLALILYGGGNGLHTIARGALPLVLFDPRHYSLFLGRLALPSLLVQAGAPTLGAWLLVGDGTLMLSVLAGAAVVALAFCLLLAGVVRRVE
jgi:MFS family permease